MSLSTPELLPKEFDTVPKMFWHGVQQRRGKIMIRQKERGIWEPMTWEAVGDVVAEVAHGLVALGLRPGEVVSVLANTMKEWIWSDLGALSAGGVVSGIYPTDAAEQVEYLCRDSRTVFLFVEDEEQLDKYLAVRERLPDPAGCDDGCSAKGG